VTLIQGVGELGPAVVICLIVAKVVHCRGEADVAVALEVCLTYITVIVFHRVPVLREVADRLYQAAEILLDFDSSDLVLAVAVNFGADVLFSLHQSVLDVCPRGILKGKETEEVAMLQGAFDLMVLIEGLAGLAIEGVMTCNKEDVTLLSLSGWRIR